MSAGTYAFSTHHACRHSSHTQMRTENREFCSHNCVSVLPLYQSLMSILAAHLSVSFYVCSCFRFSCCVSVCLSRPMQYHWQHSVQVRIARIFNTYGERMLENDGRIISNFITQALKGDDITVYGDGSQVGEKRNRNCK